MSDRARSVDGLDRTLPVDRPPRASLRIFNALIFGAFAAVGFGLVARPARLALHSLGLTHPVLPWDVPWGRVFLLLALGLFIETLRLGLAVSSGRKLRALARVPLLLLVVAALVARNIAGDPLPPASATPRLVSALRAAADALDRNYSDRGHYDPEAADLEPALAEVGRSYFVYRGRELGLQTRLIERATGAQSTPLPNALPGTIYLSLSSDRTQLFLTALSLDADGRLDVVRTSTGRPLIIEARAGTHSAPGRDHLVPEYPGMHSALTPKAKVEGR